MLPKKLIFILFLLLFLTISIAGYGEYNYKYIYIKDYNHSNYLYIIDIDTNKTTKIDLNNILPPEENVDYVSEIDEKSSSEYQVFSISTKNKNYWFIVNKRESTKNYIIPDPSISIPYGHSSILFDNVIFYPTYHKKWDYCIYDILNNKSYIIPNFNKSILALGSLPKSIQTSIKQTKEKYFYDYDTSELGNIIFSENKIYFTIKYYLGGGGVGRWPNLQYVRWASINIKTKTCTVEKENFYVVEALYKISNDIVLLFTKDKIIKYNLAANTESEFFHKLDFESPNDVFNRIIKIYPQTYSNNKIYFITNNPYLDKIKKERRQLISFDFNKSDIIFDKYETNYLLDTYFSNNSLFLLAQDKNEKDLIFSEFNLNGKSLSKIKLKGSYPYQIFGTQDNNLYIKIMDGTNFILLTYDIVKKKIINKNILK